MREIARTGKQESSEAVITPSRKTTVLSNRAARLVATFISVHDMISVMLQYRGLTIPSL